MTQRGLWIWIGGLIVFAAVFSIGFMINGQILIDLQQKLLEKERRILELELRRNAAESKINEVYQQQENIFDYIIAKNPRLTTREIADLVSYAFQLGEEYQIDPYKILAICDVENNFDLYLPGAAGEQGPMQLMKSTWDLYYKQFGYSDLDFTNWGCNMTIATYHLRELLRKHNYNWDRAIFEYNGGPNGYKKDQCKNHLRKFQIASRGILKFRSGKLAQTLK